jgi:hypothetical protein
VDGSADDGARIRDISFLGVIERGVLAFGRCSGVGGTGFAFDCGFFFQSLVAAVERMLVSWFVVVGEVGCFVESGCVIVDIIDERLVFGWVVAFRRFDFVCVYMCWRVGWLGLRVRTCGV